MSASRDLSSRRLCFLALCLALPPLVVCNPPPLTDGVCETQGGCFVSSYVSELPVCVAEQATVSVDGLVDDLDLMNCTNLPDTALVEGNVGGIDARTEFDSQEDSGSVALICWHHHSGDLANPAECDAETTHDLGYAIGTQRPDPGNGLFRATLIEIEPPGADPGDGATATAEVSCDGGATVAVPFAPADGVEVGLLNQNGSCRATLTIDSQARSGGTTHHILSLQFVQSRLCTRDSECIDHFRGAADFCGPDGLCQDGIEPDTCVSPASCAEDHYCHQVGVGVVQCFDGSLGDPCSTADHCAAPLACVAGACT